METVIQLRGLNSSGWFDELNKSLLARNDLAHIQLEEIRPAPGTFGAVWTPGIKTGFSTVAELASVLGLAVTLYALGSPPLPQSCQVSFTSESTRIEVVVPCQAEQSPEFVKTVMNALSNFSEGPPAVEVRPQSEP